MAGPKIESRKATDIAYIEHRGPYDKIPWGEYIERLYSWAKAQKVMPGFYPFAMYYNDPMSTAPADLKSEIAINYRGKAKEQGGIKVKKLPAMKVASMSHKGPGTEFKNTYAKLNEWKAGKGYVCSGPSMEIYTKKPEVVNGVTILYAKVMMPVKKK